MRKVDFEEYNKKRKAAKIELLKIRDNIEKKAESGYRSRDDEKRFLLFQLAKKKKQRIMKKIGERKYKLL